MSYRGKRSWQRHTLLTLNLMPFALKGNCRVRDGNRCFPLRYCHQDHSFKVQRTPNFKSSPRSIGTGHSIFVLHLAYLPGNLPGTLPPRKWKSHLGEGFVLRCFQHLSTPDIATQRCPWRDNWYTTVCPTRSLVLVSSSNFLRLRWMDRTVSTF